MTFAVMRKGEMIEMRDPCKECIYYHSENNTCQSKKCATTREGYVTLWDKLHCKPYKLEWINKMEREDG